MLLHLYGLDYLKEPGKDDASSTSKKYRKRSEYLNTETRREGEPHPAWRRIDTESPRTRLCTGRQRYRACSNVCNCRLSYHHDLQNATRHKFRVTLTGLRDIRRIVELFNLVGNQELLCWMRRLTPLRKYVSVCLGAQCELACISLGLNCISTPSYSVLSD